MKWSWVGLVAMSVVAAATGLAIGSVDIPPAEVLRALFDGTATEATIVRDLRLPRVLLGFLVGGSLAVSGAVLQALIRNPLADPYLLGLSGGAALGAVVVIAMGLTAPWVLPLSAFVGAGVALALVYRLSSVKGRRLDSHVLILAGVVVASFTGALVGAILSLASAARLRNAFLWMLGGLGGASWPTVTIFAAYALIPLGLLFWHARDFDLLALGDDTAGYLGADPARLKRLAFVTTGVLTAAAVAMCGMIGFVGLVVPHAIRRTAGPLHSTLLPASFLLGGSFLVVADTIARSVVSPLELPVGVVTALVGVPLFAVLLRRTIK